MDVISTASEYLVKLGVQMDTSDMAKFQAFLKSGKVQAVALSGALVALGKATYNFLKTQLDYQEELEKLAKKQSKAINNVRAEQNALKAMNKTLQEINKDGELKKIYKDLVAIGKETPLPDFDKVTGSVKEMQSAFYGLKYEVQYTMQWISYYMLKEFEGPIKEITSVFNELKDWLKANMQTVGRNVGVILGDLGRGITGILTSVTKVSELIGEIPNSVKLIAAAFAILNSGPLGILISGLTFIGDLMKDYENYKWKQENADLAGTENYDNLLIGLPEVWAAIDAADSLPDKITSGLGSLKTLMFGEDGNLFTFLTSWIDDPNGGQAVIDFGKKVWGLICQGFTLVNGASSSAAGFLLSALGFTEDGTGISENPAWGVAANTLIKKLLGVDDKTNLITAIAELFAVEDGDISAAAIDVTGFALQLWEVIKNGFRTLTFSVGDIVSVIFENMTSDGYDASTDAGLLKTLEANKTAFGSIGATIVGFIAGGTTGGFATIIGSILSNSSKDFYKRFKDGNWEEISEDDLRTVLGVDKDFDLSTLVFGENGTLDGNSNIKKQSFLEYLTSFAQDVWSELKIAFKNTRMSIGEILVSVISEYTDNKDAIAAIEQNSDIYAGIGSTILAFILGGIGPGLATGLMNIISGSQFGDIKEALMSDGSTMDVSNLGYEVGVGDTIGNLVVQSISTKIYSQRISEVFTSIIEAIRSGINSIKTFFSGGEGSKLFEEIKSVFEDLVTLMFGDDGIFSDLGEGLAEFFSGLWDAISPYIDILIYKINKSLYDQFGGTLLWNILGLKEPDSPVVADENGNFVYASEYEKTHTANETAEARARAIESGVDDILNGEPSWELSQLSVNEDGDVVSQVASNAPKPSNKYGYGRKTSAETWLGFIENGVTRTGSDLTNSDILAISKEYNLSAELLSDGSIKISDSSDVIGDASYDIQKAAKAFKEWVNSLPAISAEGTTETENAWGGRISHEMNNMTVGEDGVEYIIPITKPKRAAELIKQMVSEMGSGAASSIMDALGIGGDSSTIGGSMINGLSGVTAPVINYYNNVTANTTINVNGTGDARDIGAAAYNAHERYLVRTLQGVFA